MRVRIREDVLGDIGIVVGTMAVPVAALAGADTAQPDSNRVSGHAARLVQEQSSFDRGAEPGKGTLQRAVLVTYGCRNRRKRS
jgi:hypothetical protein